MHVSPVNGASIPGYGRSPHDQALINQFVQLFQTFEKDPNDANAANLQKFVDSPQNLKIFSSLTHKLNGADGLLEAWQGAKNILDGGLWKTNPIDSGMLNGDLAQIKYIMTGS